MLAVISNIIVLLVFIFLFTFFFLLFERNETNVMLLCTQLSYDLTWQKLKEKFGHCGECACAN